MKIDKNLNIIIKLTDEDGNAIIAHNTPLPTSVFEVNWKFFREVYDDISSMKNPSPVLMTSIFKEVAENMGKQKEAEDILSTIRGGTYVYTGQPQLFDIADVSEDVKNEILSKILFFIVFRRHLFPSQFRSWLALIKTALNLELSSSSAMELWSSSTTPTAAEPTTPSPPLSFGI